MARAEYRKARANAPTGYFAWEAAGLRWLAGVEGGATVAEVRDVDEGGLTLTRIEPGRATREAAESLGRGLARTHAAGADGHGAPPEGWEGDGFLGPLDELLPLRLDPTPRWGEFYAEQRILFTLRLGLERGTYTSADVPVFEEVAERVSAGQFDDAEPASRLHGDLWSGNVMFIGEDAVLIDPAAHGGNRETDLAMLALFGCPHLEAVLGAYEETHPLADGWQDRVMLHQLHPLMVHAVLFGGGFVGQSRAVAKRYR